MSNTIKSVSETLNENISKLLKTDSKYSMLLATKPHSLKKIEYNKIKNNYKAINNFFTITNDLVYRALFKEDKKLYNIFFLGRSDKGKRVNEHKIIYKTNPNPLPLFFRTDEVLPGKIVEIQCPGSGLAQLGELQRAWQKYCPEYTWPDYSLLISKELKKLSNNKSVIYIPKSLNPQDTQLFIASSEKQGINYIPCNTENYNIPDTKFLKTHNYHSLRKYKIFSDILHKIKTKQLIVDVPPSMIYSMKLIMALPFEKITREYYPDSVRKLFHNTYIIKPDGFIEVDGKKLNYKEYSKIPDKKRQHIIKLADGRGKNIDGGKSVFSLSRVRKNKCRDLLHTALKDYENNRPWIIQDEIRQNCDYEYLKDDEIKKENGYAKFSGYYGPSGLISIQAQYKNFYKVSGSNTTACAPVIIEQNKKSP